MLNMWINFLLCMYYKQKILIGNLKNLADFMIYERKKVKSLSCVQLFVTPWILAMGFSRQ